MIHEPRNAGAPQDATWDRLLEKIRYDGAYPTRERAEDTLRAVLTALGRQVTGDERVALAAALPREAARAFTTEAPALEQLGGAGFVYDLALRTAGTPATARWDAGVVLTAVAGLVGDELVTRLVRRLPPGYALLFGRAELAPAA
ncbi:DUF2267 domain-containing protein [Streptomyces sp. C11-1]|uniref:DUF2267 domain-containing protein n=1 Tax=Streptomyces durocortorensis TaxID=2811104 RepID=A0ABY9VNT9_9ACTN|nr:DUF2267 domain-containing protein [Streptomyces durocortorensis]WNF25601.1 DUF2267 domain-containing protein [Streptomyces durocortorensis]